MLTPDEFRELIEAFLVRTETTPTRFGIDAVRDPNFVHDIRKGRVPSLGVAGAVLRFMEERERSVSIPSTPEVAA